MIKRDYIFTSESVSEGHPDKICDQISDALLDAILQCNLEARVAVETLVTKNMVVLAGEVGPEIYLTKADMEEIVRATVREIGYEQSDFHWQNMKVKNKIHGQSADIAKGVDASKTDKSEGAGDQGMMFGYACRETEALMPAPVFYAHKILFNMAVARKTDQIEGLGPDSKSQISLRYENGKPVGAHSVLVSTQHEEGLSQQKVRALVRPFVEEVLPKGWMCPDEQFYVNPTGQFTIGGPVGDTGLTGRKIIVDTYGGRAPHGGGAFSGKDPTKVDRSAAYAARYLAKNIIAAGLASECTIQLAYAIGRPELLAFYIDTHGTGNMDDSILEKHLLPEPANPLAANNIMDLSPRGIRKHLGLNKPIYKRTAAYGHFGRAPEPDGGFSWERVDLVDKIKSALS
ncbi:MAG: methionine adenosyltransferase [Alphaproteobacteria bacterium]|nr:methionine adenosyltransferase [Alphaproteobacteria bacterium]